MKLLAFDLDGTIVTRDRVLPEEIRQAILRAEAAGHAVTVITGRTELSARPYLAALGLHRPYGTSQGARVAFSDGTILAQSRLDPSVVRDILSRHADDQLSYFLAAGQHFYVAEPEHPSWDWARAEGHRVAAYHAYAGEPADKLLFVSSDPASLHARLLEAFPELQFYPWDDRYLEVTMGGAHKGEALRRIAAELGVPRSDTIAFGDGLNDVSMIAWAGRGIAVGEADPRVLEVADERIAGPEEAGVARWLEANLLA